MFPKREVVKTPQSGAGLIGSKISPPFFKEGCPDGVGWSGSLRINALKYVQLEQTTPSKFDFVRILPPLLEKEGKLKTESINLALGAAAVHAFHTSLTEIQYNTKEKSLEISIRMFTDDLETALTKANNGQKVMLGGKNDNSNAVLSKYIQQHFAILTPQKQKKFLTVLGKESEGDATWIYVEIPNSQDFKGHILYNNLMQEMFDDQTNLVNFIYLGNKKTYLFNSKTRAIEIEI